MLTFSFHFSLFNNLSVFLEKPKLAQFIPRLYDQKYYKNSRVFLGRYIPSFLMSHFMQLFGIPLRLEVSIKGL